MLLHFIWKRKGFFWAYESSRWQEAQMGLRETLQPAANNEFTPLLGETQDPPLIESKNHAQFKTSPCQGSEGKERESLGVETLHR